MGRIAGSARRVLLVADRPGAGGWCASLIATTPGLSLVAWFTGLDEAVGCVDHLGIDVCLLSIRPLVPPAVHRFRELYPNVLLVFVTSQNLDLQLPGTAPRLNPAGSRADLLAAIAGRTPAEALRPRGSGPGAELSGREREVALLMAEGFSNREIARMLSISIHTVKNHAHHVLCKLGAERRGHLHRGLAAPWPDRLTAFGADSVER
jgi:DNA-binding CsgD family transcriptional regulator